MSSDFNNYNICGIYTGNEIGSISNSPVTSGNFTLEVLKLNLNSQYLQRLTVRNNDTIKTYERIFNEDSWSDWYCSYSSKKKLLWSGAYYMNESQTINLSEPVNQQSDGLELVFAPYIDGEKKNYDHSIHRVSKEKVANHLNSGIGFTMFFGTFDGICKKFLRITNTQITGDVKNTETGTKNGIVYNNQNFVLSEVYGV